ncbi:MAG TPA: hypothetical protein VGK52_01690 [Polyangia bacterium]|jgi:uncharacterized membrane protein YeaQ/YmgE (transglycosylase-associated protein family)
MLSVVAAISWVAVGFFVAWIGTHLEANGPAKGVSNIGVGVLGALIGGLAMQAAIGGRSGYDAYLVCSASAMIVSSIFVGLTDFRARRGLRQHSP